MSSNWIKFLFIFCFKFQLVTYSQSYCDQYPKECKYTFKFFSEYQEKFEQVAQKVGLSTAFIFSIVAPEISQFSYLSDKLETYSLKVMYVQGGKSYANFSIGYFQMKPSFVEELEKFIESDKLLKKKFSSCLFEKPKDRSARVTRIDRLSTIEWQLYYLTAFCEILQMRFNNIKFINMEDRLQFFASAYNCGFYKSVQQIKKTANVALFPYFSKEKYRYADLSNFFYQQLSQK